MNFWLLRPACVRFPLTTITSFPLVFCDLSTHPCFCILLCFLLLELTYRFPVSPFHPCRRTGKYHRSRLLLIANCQSSSKTCQIQETCLHAPVLASTSTAPILKPARLDVPWRLEHQKELSDIGTLLQNNHIIDGDFQKVSLSQEEQRTG